MRELDHYIKLTRAAIQSPNLAERFGEVDRRRIAEWVYAGYQRDCASRKPWEKRMQAAMDLALQLQKEKTYPWPGSSNVAFPLITISTLQFHSRAYPALVDGTELVKCRVLVTDPDGSLTARADRVSSYMSYQMLEEDSSWEEQQDRLLINIPVVGCAFKKTYYDPSRGLVTSELVMAKDLVVDYWAKSIETAQRKTHIIPKYRNDIYEAVKRGLYCNVLEEGWYRSPSNPNIADNQRDLRQGRVESEADADTPFMLLEQHCSLDLDGDGYAEPYVVLIEENSKALLRITARFEREEDILRNGKGEVISIHGIEYFTKYGFIPSPDGGIYDLGFGILLGPLNESVNTIFNQLIDSGTMSNLGGGFLGRGAKIRGGAYTFAPMEWKRVDSTGDDLRKNIVPLQTPAPSEVLLKLLALLIDYTNRISGATEMLAGKNPGQNTPAQTSETMVEQGMKIYSAIFKRVWRSMKEEFKKRFILNGLYLPDEQTLGNGIIVMREDYLGDMNAIVPAANPHVVSEATRVQQAQGLAQRAAQVPGYDHDKVERNLLKAFNVQDADVFFLGAQKTGPLPNAKLEIEKMKAQVAQGKIQLDQMKLKQSADQFVIQMMETHALNEAHISQMEATATKLLSESKGAESQQQISAINAMIGAERSHNEILMGRINALLKSVEVIGNADKSGAMEQLDERPGNPGGEEVAPPLDSKPQGPLGGRRVSGNQPGTNQPG